MAGEDLIAQQIACLMVAVADADLDFLDAVDIAAEVLALTERITVTLPHGTDTSLAHERGTRTPRRRAGRARRALH